MKNKKIFIALLLVASLALGIGYAALTSTLTINGAAGVSQEALDFTEDIVFVSASSNNEAFGTAAINAGGQTATFTATGMTRAQERVQFTYVIENNSDYNVNIEISTHPTTSDSSGWFTVTTALGSNTIAAHGTVNATVTVVLNSNADAPVGNINYVIAYTATTAGTP